MKVLDLFSGIGGFSLGLERTGGFETVAFCEIDPFCRRVLAKHWPEVKQYEDVRTLDAATLRRDGIAADFICGGFPCQDVSHAGKRAGLEGARSGLWSHYSRLIGELRPRGVLVENVPGLLSLGLGNVLGDLAAIGYDAVWDCVPAGSIGAPHIRDRVWLFAYPQHPNADDAGSYRAAIDIIGKTELRHEQERQSGSMGDTLADSASGRRGKGKQAAASVGYRGVSPPASCATHVADATGTRRRAGESSESGPARDEARRARLERLRCTSGADAWIAEPDVGRVAHGIPSRVDRLRSLGNAVVPQIPELIGNAILSALDLKAALPSRDDVQER